jgi:nucleoside-diphosphate-sugar epimerase
MRVVTLGGEGQVGRPLVKALKSKGYDVTDFDIVNGHDLAEIGNIEINEAIYEADFVYFLAFDVGGSEYLKDYQFSFQFIDNNIALMNNVFNILHKFNKPFIFSSSQMSNMNHSPYGVLKRLGEFYTKSLGGVNVRFWNVYGIEHDPAKFHVITDFINMAKGDGHIQMRTNGDERRQFLYADDACEALITLGNHFPTLTKDRNYDITSFEWNSISEVAEMVAGEFGATWSRGEIFDTIQNKVENLPEGTILKYWEPKIFLKEGIKRIIEDMK